MYMPQTSTAVWFGQSFLPGSTSWAPSLALCMGTIFNIFRRGRTGGDGEGVCGFTCHDRRLSEGLDWGVLHRGSVLFIRAVGAPIAPDRDARKRKMIGAQRAINSGLWANAWRKKPGHPLKGGTHVAFCDSIAAGVRRKSYKSTIKTALTRSIWHIQHYMLRVYSHSVVGVHKSGVPWYCMHTLIIELL